jgi:capsular exopolysaccharide synthesis family protein
MTKAPLSLDLAFDGDETAKPLEMQGLLHALLAKAWLVVLCASVGGVLGFWWVQRQPLLYISKTVVEIELQEQRAIKLKDDADQRDLRSPEIIQTIMENFRNRSLMERVSRSLNLTTDAAFLGRKSPEPASLEEVVQRLTGASSARIREKTRLIDVSFTHGDPIVAQKVAAALVQQFLELGTDQRLKTLEMQNKVLVQKASELKVKLKQSEETMLAYKKNLESVSLEERRNLVDEKLRALNADLTQGKGERLRIESDMKLVQDLSGDAGQLLAVTSVAQDPEVVSVRERLSGANAEVAQLAQRYRDKFPDLVLAREKAAKAQAALQEVALSAPLRLATRYNEAVAREKGLQEAVTEQEKAALELDEKVIPFRALQREADSDKALFESVLQRLKESDLALGLQSVSFRIVEPAVPATLMPTKQMQTISGGAFGGALLAAALVAGLFFLDSSLRTVDDAERLIGLPVLAAVPFMEKVKHRKDGLAIRDKPDSPVAESFRSLRSSLSLLGPEIERRVFLVSSAIPGEGKTTVSANIAIAFAQQGLRTLLIDADLRRPSLTKLFDLANEVGVAEYVAGGESPLLSVGIPNLSLLPAGSKAPNPAELLASPRFAELITRLKEQFDRIVIDSAPLNVVSDTFSILGLASTVVLVVRTRSTPRRVVRRALELLQRARVRPAGLVLNCMPKWNGVGYHYYYSSHNKYGGDQTYGQGYNSGATVTGTPPEQSVSERAAVGHTQNRKP